jgi:hypothetical protein
MTVREPIPDLADAVPVPAPAMETMVAETSPAQVGAGSAVRRRVRSPLLVAAVLLYATTALLLLTFPHSASAWLDDFTPTPTIRVLRAGTGALEAAAEKLGIAAALEAVRGRFLKQIQRPD